MRQSRSLGQVFLSDKNFHKKILAQLQVKDEDVFEIGAGDGRMSQYIAEQSRTLVCVELDSRFAGLIKEMFAGNSRVEVINADVLKVSLSGKGRDFVVFGNVPYQISNSLMHYLIQNRGCIKKAWLTLQKEFVQKIIAVPSSKSYGFLSCCVQYYAKVRKLFDIPRFAFSPVPEVDSTFIILEFYDQLPYKAADEERLFGLIRKAFSARRKKLANALSMSDSQARAAVSLGIDTNARPENITLEQFVSLSNSDVYWA